MKEEKEENPEYAYPPAHIIAAEILTTADRLDLPLSIMADASGLRYHAFGRAIERHSVKPLRRAWLNIQSNADRLAAIQNARETAPAPGNRAHLAAQSKERKKTINRLRAAMRRATSPGRDAPHNLSHRKIQKKS